MPQVTLFWGGLCQEGLEGQARSKKPFPKDSVELARVLGSPGNMAGSCLGRIHC